MNADMLKELFAGYPIPEPFKVYERVPAFWMDFYRNFSRFVWRDGYLNASDKIVIAFAVSAHLRCDWWTPYLKRALLSLGYTEADLAEVLAISATCSLSNTFHRLQVGQVAGPRLLRMHTLAETPISHLVCMAISNLNGCQVCTAGHAEAVRGVHGQLAVTEAIQCAATMVAGCGFLAGLRATGA